MPRLEFVDEFINDYFDVIVEVEFANKISSGDVHRLLQYVVKITSGQLAAFLFEGFSSIQIDKSAIRTDFRFARVPKESSMSGEEQEDRSRQQVQFIFCLFANISNLYPFASHPFPSSYEAFTNMPEELGFEN